MKSSSKPSRLSAEERANLLSVLKARFQANTSRHASVSWGDVQDRLDSHPEKLIALHEMERTGGAPDVNGRDGQSGEIVFCDCCPESPAGRRSLCYDGEALASTRTSPRKGAALDPCAGAAYDQPRCGECVAIGDIPILVLGVQRKLACHLVTSGELAGIPRAR